MPQKGFEYVQAMCVLYSHRLSHNEYMCQITN